MEISFSFCDLESGIFCSTYYPPSKRHAHIETNLDDLDCSDVGLRSSRMPRYCGLSVCVPSAESGRFSSGDCSGVPSDSGDWLPGIQHGGIKCWCYCLDMSKYSTELKWAFKKCHAIYYYYIYANISDDP